MGGGVVPKILEDISLKLGKNKRHLKLSPTYFSDSLKTPYQQPSPYSQFSLKLCTDRPPETLIESDITRGCMYTTVSSWRWGLEARNM